MEINAGTIAQQPHPPRQQSGQQQLSEQQQESISDILSEYDSQSLTAGQASTIVEQFQTQNIGPSKQFAEVLSDAGFDAREIAELAGIETPEQSRRPSNGSASFESSIQNNSMALLTDDEQLSKIEELMAILEDSNSTQEQRLQTFIAISEVFEQYESDGLISTYA